MKMNLVDKVNAKQIKPNTPEFRVGDTVKVDVWIKEGKKERIQAFEGLVVSKKGGSVSERFTVRKKSGSVGVLRTFAVNSPEIDKITVIKKGMVRRAKLNFLRGMVKEFKVKERRNQKRILIGCLIITILIMIGFTYAYYRKTVTQASPNTGATLTCLNTTLTDKTSAINIVEAISISDAEGLTTDPYTFTITNNCSTYVKASINLEVLSTSTFDSSHIRVALVGEGVTPTTSSILSSNQTATATISGATSYTIKTNIILGPNSNKSFDLRAWVDKDTTLEQGMNKIFNSKITIVSDAVQPHNEAEGFAWIHNGEVTTNGGMKSISQSATTQLRATTEYRYYGANPNNYVTFNGELWRIIGVFETENESGTLEYRVKLIRNEKIGSYSWDTSASTVNSGWGINEWSQADLMKLLNPGYESNQDLNNSGATITVNNSLYWTKGSGTCYNGQSNATTTCDFTSTGLGTEAKSMIDKAKFYTAGSNSFTTSLNYYTAERGSTVYTGPSDGVTRTTSWVGYIGLMYISDYGYGADESICGSSTLLSNYYSNTACHTNDWLWKSSSSQWWSVVPNSS